MIVVSPSYSFVELSGQIARLGWQPVGDPTAMPPLLEGEPEIARWEDPSRANTLYYEFRPATKFRSLWLEGPATEALADDLKAELPALGVDDAEQLMGSEDSRSIILGIQVVEVLGGYSLASDLLALTEHPDALVAQEAVRVSRCLLLGAGSTAFRTLAEWKRRNPAKSLAFLAIGDYWSKLQLLRWLMVDQSRSGGDIDLVIRTALEDDDWEVRVTAIICAARLHARSTLADVANADLPAETADGVNKDERRMLRSCQSAAIELLEGGSIPPDIPSPPTDKASMHAHILRCIAGLPVAQIDKTLLYVESMSTPLPDEVSAPVNSPNGLKQLGNTYQLAGSDIEFIWVPPEPHWLGEDLPRMRIDNPIRKAAPKTGFFISRYMINNADQPALLSCASAVRRCEYMSNDFGLRVSLPTADQWEMAARGPDGRRFPWGNNAKNSRLMRPSPWGMEQAVGVAPQWTSTAEGDDRIVCGGPKQWVCAERAPMDPMQGRAAIRLVIEDR